MGHVGIEPRHPDAELIDDAGGRAPEPLDDLMHRADQGVEIGLPDIHYFQLDRSAEQVFVAPRLLLEIGFDIDLVASPVFPRAGVDHEHLREGVGRALSTRAPQPARFPHIVEPVFQLPVGVLPEEALLAHRHRRRHTSLDLRRHTPGVLVLVGRHDHEHRPLRGEQPMGVVVDLLAAEIPGMDGGRGRALLRHPPFVEADIHGRLLPVCGAGIEWLVFVVSPPLGVHLLPAERLRHRRLATPATPQKQHLRHPQLGRIVGQRRQGAKLPGDVDGCRGARRMFSRRRGPVAAVDTADIEAAERLHSTAADRIERADPRRPPLFLTDWQLWHRFDLGAAAEIEMVEPGIAVEIGERRQPGAALQNEFFEPPRRKARIADRLPAAGGRDGLCRERQVLEPGAIDERQFLELLGLGEELAEGVGARLADLRASVEVHPPQARGLPGGNRLERLAALQIERFQPRELGLRESLELPAAAKIEGDKRRRQAVDRLEIGKIPEDEMGEAGEAAEVEPGMTAGLLDVVAEEVFELAEGEDPHPGSILERWHGRRRAAPGGRQEQRPSGGALARRHRKILLPDALPRSGLAGSV